MIQRDVFDIIEWKQETHVIRHRARIMEDVVNMASVVTLVSVHKASQGKIATRVMASAQENDLNQTNLSLLSHAIQKYKISSYIKLIAYVILISADPCANNPCGQYGRCITQGSSYICQCNPGYTGRLDTRHYTSRSFIFI